MISISPIPHSVRQQPALAYPVSIQLTTLLPSGAAGAEPVRFHLRETEATGCKNRLRLKPRIAARRTDNCVAAKEMFLFKNEKTAKSRLFVLKPALKL